MPTHDEAAQFLREFFALPPEKQRLFRHALRLMVEDLRRGRSFRPSLRVKGVQGYPGIFEMTWEMPNGRATFSYGTPRRPGDTHIIWRRVGGHDILKNP